MPAKGRWCAFAIQPIAGAGFDEVLSLKLSVVDSCERPLWSRQSTNRWPRYGPRDDGLKNLIFLWGPASGRLLPVPNGRFLEVHRVAGRKSFVYFSSAAEADFQVCDSAWPFIYGISVFQLASHMKQLTLRAALFAIPLLCACNAVIAQAPADSNPIRSVWQVKQLSCNGFVAQASTRSPDAEEIIRTGMIQIPNLDMKFSIPQIPELPATTIRLTFNDRGRGVVDHYALFTLNDLSDPIAAVMVTELPPSFDTSQKALEAAVSLERGNLEGTAAQPKFERVATAWGEGLDLFVPNRIGSPCFPAARYRLATDAQPTMGLSRFVTLSGHLIQFAVLVKTSTGTPVDMQMANARRVMDVFASGLKKP